MYSRLENDFGVRVSTVVHTVKKVDVQNRLMDVVRQSSRVGNTRYLAELSRHRGKHSGIVSKCTVPVECTVEGGNGLTIVRFKRKSDVVRREEGRGIKTHHVVVSSGQLSKDDLEGVLPLHTVGIGVEGLLGKRVNGIVTLVWDTKVIQSGMSDTTRGQDKDGSVVLEMDVVLKGDNRIANKYRLKRVRRSISDGVRRTSGGLGVVLHIKSRSIVLGKEVVSMKKQARRRV